MAGKQGAVHLVQYVALRGDLLRVQKWPIGAMVAQGCHASTAVIHMYRDHGNVIEYLSDLDRMHKVVLEVLAGAQYNCMSITICLYNFNP